jgi:hypothetical protein
MSGDRYRVIDLRAGKPGTADWWYSQLMASNLEVVEAAGIKQ